MLYCAIVSFDFRRFHYEPSPIFHRRQELLMMPRLPKYDFIYEPDLILFHYSQPRVPIYLRATISRHQQPTNADTSAVLISPHHERYLKLMPPTSPVYFVATTTFLHGSP